MTPPAYGPTSACAIAYLAWRTAADALAAADWRALPFAERRALVAADVDTYNAWHDALAAREAAAANADAYARRMAYGD